jgi:hypothetical protein
LVLLWVGPQQNRKTALHQQCTSQERSYLLPSRVEEQIEQGGVKSALERAQDEGWAKTVDAPTVSHSKETTAQDIAQRAIASKSADKDEHDVEKADPVFAGLAAEYLLSKKTAHNVTVITADRIACAAIETAISSSGHTSQVSTITIWNLIDEDDDDLTLIIACVYR